MDRLQFFEALRATPRTWGVIGGRIRNAEHQCPVEAVLSVSSGNAMSAVYEIAPQGAWLRHFLGPIFGAADSEVYVKGEYQFELRQEMLAATGLQ